MTFEDNVAIIRKGTERASLSDTLKFDCGDDGCIVLGPEGVATTDAPADCTIRISTDNLSKLLHGKLNPMTGVMMGKLKVSGNPAVAMKLGQLIS